MKVLQSVYNIVWGVPALILILGVGLYLTARTGFAQVRLLPRALRRFVAQFAKSSEGGVSSFQALCTALAATVGTGNLAGVAGAIAVGGPGAVFWMWICALLGMVIKFAEATLAVRYRQKNSDGEYVGGPMYMIRLGLPQRLRPLAGVYAFFGVVAAFGVGNATQINTVISGVNGALVAFGAEPSRWGNFAMGMGLATLIGAILLGGAGRIGQITEKLVPFAAGLYLIMGAWVLILRLDALPGAFLTIFRGAFEPAAVTGGMVGSAMIALRTGVSRGVFTNEAGMGTAAIAHAAANVEDPVEQGMMGIVEVFLDTIVICTVTALVILCSGVPISYGVDAGVRLTTEAFSAVLGQWVTAVIALSLCLFALATVLGWGLYGIRCAQFLFGEGALRCFAWLQVAVVLVGAVLSADTVWLVAEVVNGLMAIPNLIAIGALTPQLTDIYKSYLHGGRYENFHQRKPLRVLSHAHVPPAGGGCQGAGKDHLPSEHRSAGSSHTSSIF